MKTHSWSKYIGIIDYWHSYVNDTERYDFCYFEDGSVGFAVSVDNFDDLSYTDDAKTSFINNYINLVLKQIDDYTEISIMQYPDRYKEFFDNFINNCNSDNETIKHLNKEYIDNLYDDYVNFNISILKTVFFYRFFPSKSVPLKKNKRFVYKTDTWKNINDESIDTYISFYNALEKAGMKPVKLNIHNILKIITYILNPHIYLYYPDYQPSIDNSYRFYSNPLIVNSKEENTQPVNFQVGFTNLVPDYTNPYFDYNNERYYFSSIQFVKYPDTFYYGNMNLITSINTPFFFITNLRILNQKSNISELRRKIKVSSLYLNTSKNPSVASTEAHEDKENMLSVLEKDGHKLLDVNQTIILFNPDKDILRNQSKAIINELRSLSIFPDSLEGKNETLYINALPFKSITKDSFSSAFSNLIGSKPSFRRYYPLTTSTNVAAVLTSFFDTNKGCNSPYIIFKDARNHRPIGLDPFNTAIMGSPNFLITGGTGSGKSFVGGMMILKLQNRKAPVYVISLDKGGSNSRLLKYLGGISLTIDPNNPNTVFNIFHTSNPNIYDPSARDDEGKLSDIANYLMSLSNPNEQSFKFTPDDKINLIQSIRDAYSYYISKNNKPLDDNDPTSFPRLQDYIRFIEKDKSASIYVKNDFIRNIVRQVKSYIGSPYNNLVNSFSPKFEYKRMVSFDLEILYKDQSMRDILTSEVIKLSSYTKNIINNISFKKDGARWIFFCDELWLFLTKGKEFSFITDMLESFVREARKKGGQVINASQDISDYGKEGGEYLLNNSPGKLIGRAYSAAEYEMVSETLHLNDEEKSHYLDCGVKHGYYSKFFYIGGNCRSPIIIEPTSIEYNILTSDPNDMDHQYKYYKDHSLDPNDFKSVIQYSLEFPRGFASSLNRK